MKLLEHPTDRIDKVKEATINIYLMKGTHYWVDSDKSDTNTHNIDYTTTTDAFILKAFDRTSSVVTIR